MDIIIALFRALLDRITGLTTERDNLMEERDMLLQQIERSIDEQNPVLLPREVAEAIEKAWQKKKDHHNVSRHLYLTNWSQLKVDCDEQLRDVLGNYANKHPVAYMSAIVNGYTVEEPKLLNLKDEIRLIHDDHGHSPERLIELLHDLFETRLEQEKATQSG